MKFLLFSFLVLSPLITVSNTANAQSMRRPHPNVHVNRSNWSNYCTDERFTAYASIASAMRDYVTPEEYSRIYLPLKVLSSKASITLKHFGPLSETTHRSLRDIVAFISRNQNSFDALWEIEAFTAVAMDMMDITVALSRDLE